MAPHLAYGALALPAPGPVEAQEPAGSGGIERWLRAAADVRYTIHENYFQAPLGQPDSVVRATGIRVRLISDVVRRVGAELYIEGGMTSYDAFIDPTFGFGAGLRGGRGRFHLDLGAGYEFDFPAWISMTPSRVRMWPRAVRREASISVERSN